MNGPIRVGRNNPKPTPCHKSLDRVRNKAMAMVEVSAAHYVDEKNERGWGYPHYTDLPEFGWDLALFDYVSKRREAGYKLLGLWEPGGIYYPKTNENMGYFNYNISAKTWTKKMVLSWTDPKHGGFLAKLRDIDMEPMFYFNANENLDRLVDDVAWVRSALGVHIFGLDAFSWIVHTDVNKATAVINALRADSRTEDATFITEGQLPLALSDADRRFFLTNLAQLELARGGKDKKASDDTNLTRILPVVDDGLVKNPVRFVMCHGSDWQAGDLENVYQFMRASGCQPCDWRDAPLDWK